MSKSISSACSTLANHCHRNEHNENDKADCVRVVQRLKKLIHVPSHLKISGINTTTGTVSIHTGQVRV